MSSVLYLRMFGYSVTLAVHLVNTVIMNNALQGPAMQDPYIKEFSSLHMRFFTVWTSTVQMFYAAIGLTCDYLILKNAANEEYKLPKLLKQTRDTVFAAILWPTVFLVFTLFWTLYHYDRSLIYPLFADKVMTRAANHIVHTAIVPVVLWEIVLQPRDVPKSHAPNITMLTVYMVTYLNIMCYTYLEKGIWMYPIFGQTHKTLYFPLIIFIIGVMLVCYYHMQWYITKIVWGAKGKRKKSYN